MMKRTMIFLSVTLMAAYAVLCLVVYVQQRSLIFYPQPRALSPTENMRFIDVPGAKLVLTVREAPGEAALIYFGGNAEDVSQRLQELSQQFPQHAIYLLHYRGYGGSTGSPSEAALIADALALYAEVSRRHARITVIGRSLGSGVAVQLAAARRIERLVLVTPYYSMVELAQSEFSYLPVRWLMRDPFESWRYVATISAPTTIIEAENDEVIPRASTEKLYASFPPGRASYHRLAGANHNNVSAAPEYYRLLAGS